jgi:small-conductance mechanosensitive channel
MPELPIDYLGIAFKVLLSIATIVTVWIVYRVVKNVVKRRIEDVSRMHTLRMLVRNALFFLGGVMLLLIWLGPGSNLTVAMGLLGAGIAFASQEVIGSFAGYLNVVTGNLYRIGDRVRIGNVTGDVMDLSILRTTVMEIGEWVRADQYTGRIVTIANRAVFADPVYNYTQHWGYLWDEITIPVTYASDWPRATEILLERGHDYTEELQADAEAGMAEMRERFPLQYTQVEPAVYLRMTDNWVEITMRYIVDARERRKVNAQLQRELLQHFQREKKITIASTTIEIVGMPPLRGEIHGGQG